MAYAFQASQEPSSDLVIELLSRLWQTKLKSITAMEKWLTKTGDAEIKAGLQMQLIDERRHLRLLSDEIKRLGGRLTAQSNLLSRPFAVFLAQGQDLYRLNALYHGIKAFTLDRLGHLVPMVDGPLLRCLDLIARDEERHIRWAEIRVSRLQTADAVRDCYLLTGRLKVMLESAWSKPWYSLTSRNWSQ